jgi:hypothetical protein
MIRGLPSFRSMRLPAVAAVVVLLGVAVGASAYFTSHGTGTASASVGSINPPSNVTAQQTGADVKINWSAATLSSGGSVQGYRVERSDNTTICGSPTLVTSLSCTDTSVPSGTYTYTVTAFYNSFTDSATSSAITILTTPSITAEPSNPSASSAPSFSFSGEGGSGYQCQLDGGSFTSCSSPNVYSGLTDGSHTFKVHATQGSATSPDATYTWTIDTSAPSITAKPSNPSANASPSFSFSHTQATYAFKCQLDGGGFSACASPKSYSTLSDGSHTFQVEGVSADGAITSIASYTWLLDTTAPSGGSVSYTNGYLTSASVSVTLTQGTDSGSGVNTSSGILQRSTSPLSNGSCTGFGSFATIATNPSLSYTDSTVTDSHCYKYQYLVSDNVGNQATYTSTSVVKIDTTTPMNALSLGASPSHAFLNGSKLYFKSDTAGSFTLVNTVSDSGSGPASATFPLVSATNWTHAAQTVSTPAPGPYTSSIYSWTSGAGTPTGSQATFTSTDVAGNASANTVLTFTPDTTAPSGGSVSYTNGYLASASVSVTLTQGTDSGSGINAASGILQRSTGTLSNGSCTGFGSFSTIATNPSLSYTDSTVTDGHCYKYQYLVSDNVGNQATYTSTSVAKIDTTAPSITLTFPVQGASYSIANNGSSSWHTKSGASGACSVSDEMCGTASDAGSGVATVQISVLGANGKYWDGTLTGGGQANFTQSSQTWVTVAGTTSWTQAWSNGAFNGTGSYTVSARANDNVGNTSSTVSATFTIN